MRTDWRGRHTDFLPCRVKSCLRERAEGTGPGPCPYHFGMHAMWHALVARNGLKLSVFGWGTVGSERQFWRWMEAIEQEARNV